MTVQWFKGETTVQGCKGLETILYKDTTDKKLLYKDAKD